MNLQNEIQNAQAMLTRRRWFLGQCGVGLAGIAANTLLAQDAPTKAKSADAQSPNPLAPKQPHFPGKAKRVSIYFKLARPAIWNCLITSRSLRS